MQTQIKSVLLPQNLCSLRRTKAYPPFDDPQALEDTFVDYLFESSVKCHPNEGHKDLMMSAARTMVRYAEPSMCELAQREGRPFNWTPYGCDEFANELAAVFFQSDAVRSIVETRLSYHVNAILSDERYTNNDPGLSPLEWDFERATTSGGRTSKLSKHPMIIIIRTLEHIDGVKSQPGYRSLMPLKRALTIMLRVGSAALGRHY